MSSIVLNSKEMARCDVCGTISTFSSESSRETACLAADHKWLHLPGDKYMCATCTLQDTDHQLVRALIEHVAPRFAPKSSGQGFWFIGYQWPQLMGMTMKKTQLLRDRIQLLKDDHFHLQGEDIEDKIDRASDLILKAASAVMELAVLLYEDEKIGTFNIVEKGKHLAGMINEASEHIETLDSIIQPDRLSS